ncbi:hypothetical protein BATDEDRAFT_84890 [Batrachochytrium dendrobatidis JAM81]|uniref:Copper transporter n=1 Tax=Batrachochytrium dendrobatidis (strain JAM81 / FGSC 10211) TaxID=684364 RepID=F4NRH9_BATDJ|nr:uncharacterized protein BATDEDRAFT_84890 [Batrachochytrium dendrobatidis JAM81]EGF84162.1 hypothetical protein BATDEDRAFT_84890 [Batrachochytrium dendrobatidis JAM81]|eukprot:XP_006676355.1 hypothetical protein BATDEDRAFT_84890 [Batrachochytrium dendrobatidis JAM81]
MMSSGASKRRDAANSNTVAHSSLLQRLLLTLLATCSTVLAASISQESADSPSLSKRFRPNPHSDNSHRRRHDLNVKKVSATGISKVNSLRLTKASDDCIVDPTAIACRSYKYPSENITQNLNALCGSMPNMPGCSIRKSCTQLPTSKKWFCKEFSLLADICAADMSGMRDCSNYVKMCKTGTLVKQCYDEPPIAYLPTTKHAKQLVLDICSDMYMTGCETCQPESMCFGFDVYGSLCLSMPDMPQCNEWKRMCSKEPMVHICPLDSPERDHGQNGSPGDTNHRFGPTMKMYFHFGYSDYILFDSWVPRSTFSYALGCLFCFLLAIGYEFLLVVGSGLDTAWKMVESSRHSNDVGLGDTLELPMSGSDHSFGLYRSPMENPNISVLSDDTPLLRPRSRITGKRRTSLNISTHPKLQPNHESQNLPLCPTTDLTDQIDMGPDGEEESVFDHSMSESSSHIHQRVISHGNTSQAAGLSDFLQHHSGDISHHSNQHTPTQYLSRLYTKKWTHLQMRIGRALIRLVTITLAYICMLLVMSFNVGLFLSVVVGLAVGKFMWSHEAYGVGGNIPFNSDNLVEKEHCC